MSKRPTTGRRRRRERDYVTIENSMFKDERLSFKAKGILGYLLTKPDGWTVRTADLQKHATDGRESIETGIKELRRNGYLIYYRTKKPDGTWGGTIWEYDDVPFFEYDESKKTEIITVPFDEVEEEEVLIDEPETGKPFVGEILDTIDLAPETGKPFTEKPITEKPYYISNKDFTNKDFKKILVSSSSDLQSPEIKNFDSKLQKTYKKIPFSTIKAKLLQDADNGKVQMVTFEQYKALIEKRIEFYIQSQSKQTETAQIEAVESKFSILSTEPLETNTGESEKSESVAKSSEEVAKESSEGAKENSEGRKAIEERIKAFHEKPEAEKTPEEREFVRKDIDRMLKLLREQNSKKPPVIDGPATK